jgi:hypothetical protein
MNQLIRIANKFILEQVKTQNLKDIIVKDNMKVVRCYSNEKVVDVPKSRAQFTPMRTTAADSRTKIFITLDTKCRPNPLFD